MQPTHAPAVVFWRGGTRSDVDAVVYYVGDPDSQLVKIGTSTGLKMRVGTFRKKRPGAILLATEPGTYPLETQRHHQFGAAREWLPSGETEWYRKTPLLMAHIGLMRQTYGIICPGRPIYDSWVAPLRR